MAAGSAGSDQVWRVRSAGRISAVLLVIGWFGLALGVTLGGGAQARAVVIIWLVVPLLAIGAWRWAFVPYVALDPEAVIIQNRATKTSVPYSEISEVRGGYSGLRLTTKDGRVVQAWAVQKSNAARWLHKRTRADEVADAILTRTGR